MTFRVDIHKLRDFCSAVLADNRPRSGEPWDTISGAINFARARAYRDGFDAGVAYASGMEARQGGSGAPSRSDDSPTAAPSGGDAQPKVGG